MLSRVRVHGDDRQAAPRWARSRWPAWTLRATTLALALGATSSVLRAEADAPAARPASSALARLAESLAHDLTRLSGGQPVELLLDDRTGTDGALGADLRALTLGRLASAGVVAAPAGRRLRAETLLTRDGRMLVLSSRVTREPGAQLVDVLSASAQADAALLARGQRREPTLVPGFEVLASVISGALDTPVLDLAWLSERRLLLLTARALELYEWDGSSARVVRRRPLPPAQARVRFAAGLLLVKPREATAWALTNSMPQALQVRVLDDVLEERGTADVLPWGRAAQGVRFQPGSTLLDAQPVGLGAGPFVALEPTLEDLAVGPDGALLMATAAGATDTGMKVGPALARLDVDWIAAASPAPPVDDRDAILLLQRLDNGWSERGRLEALGPVRALAALEQADGAVRLVAALDVHGRSEARLQFFELRRSDLGAELP